MSTLSTTRNYLDGDDLTQAELDAAFDSIETWANGNIGTVNIATNGVDSAQIAASAVTSAKIASSAVTTSGIADGAVTGVKLNSGVVDNSTLAVSSNQLIIKAGGVGTSQLADASVTQAKRAALGQQISSSCGGSYSNSTSSYTAVTNLSVSITTTGRPVMLMLISDGAGGTNTAEVTASGGNGMLQWLRNSTEIATYQAYTTFISPAAFSMVDVVTTGTYTYSVKMKCNGASSVAMQYTKLLAFEL